MDFIILKDNRIELENEMSDIYSTLQHFCNCDTDVVWAEGLSTRVLRTEYVDIYFKTWDEAKKDRSLVKRYDLIFGVTDTVIDLVRKDIGNRWMHKFCSDNPVPVIMTMNSMLQQHQEQKYKAIINDILKRRRWL